MKPAPFAYHRPRTREEVDALLGMLGPDAKILAGGQSLIPLLNMRLATPSHVIDINRLEAEPAQPVLDADVVAIGPLVRYESVERSPEVSSRLPVLREAIGHVGHPAIRSRGTVVGSIAHADPAAELPAVLVVLNGEVRIRSAGGHRTVRAEEFLVGPFQPALHEEEWVEEVRFPAPSTPRGFAFDEFARRSGDYALCGVVSVAERNGGGRLKVAQCYMGMGPVPVLLELPPMKPEELAGGVLDEALQDVTRARLEPLDDLHASREYRLWLARRLGARTVLRAAASIPAGDY